MAKNDKVVKVLSVELIEDKVHAVLRMDGELTRLEGTREIWKAPTSYKLKVELNLTDALARYGADRKIALATPLRTTNPKFISELNERDEAWTYEEIVKKAAPFVAVEAALKAASSKTAEELEVQIAKLQAQLALKKAQTE